MKAPKGEFLSNHPSDTPYVSTAETVTGSGQSVTVSDERRVSWPSMLIYSSNLVQHSTSTFV